MLRKIIIQILLLMGVAAIVGLSALYSSFKSKEKEQEFTKAGLSITLPNTFSEGTYENTTVFLDGDNIVFGALKKEFSLFEQVNTQIKENTPLDQYTSFEIQINLDARTATPQNSADGTYQYFSYVTEGNGKALFTMSATFKSSDAFWICSFICDNSKRQENEAQFIKWFDSVQFN